MLVPQHKCHYLPWQHFVKTYRKINECTQPIRVRKAKLTLNILFVMWFHNEKIGWLRIAGFPNRDCIDRFVGKIPPPSSTTKRYSHACFKSRNTPMMKSPHQRLLGKWRRKVGHKSNLTRFHTRLPINSRFIQPPQGVVELFHSWWHQLVGEALLYW